MAEEERALGYVRVSTVRQVKEGESIASQTETIAHYAKTRGLSLRSRDIVIDDGVSASIHLWERRGGKSLLKKAESGRYKHLIVTKLDRVFRVSGDAVLTIDELDDMDMRFHIIDLGGQSFDSSNALGRFVVTFLAAIAELERGLISERTREAIQFRRSKGMRFTHSIYGWKHDKRNRMRPDWKEQDGIDYMVWQMKNGASATSVARMMNKRGMKAKKGGKWYAGTVLRVTKNPYHKARMRFPHPDWWGKKPWHRRKRGDQKVITKIPAGKWDKDDLA